MAKQMNHDTVAKRELFVTPKIHINFLSLTFDKVSN